MPPGPDCACGLRREEGTCVFESARQPRALEPDRYVHWVRWKHCAFRVHVSEGKSVWAALTKCHRLGLNKASVFSQF